MWPLQVVYERQLTALLHLASMERPDPVSEMLLAGQVGRLDAWAQRFLKGGGKGRGKGQRLGPADEPAWLGAKESQAEAEGEDAAPAEAADAAPAEEAATAPPKGPSRCATLAEERLLTARQGVTAEEAEGQLEKALEQATDLNDSQKGAVSAAVSRRCTIIQGPPGTGKTHVAVKVIDQWVRSAGLNCVLATSDSNVAVDNIAEGLHRAGVKVVRLGRPEKVREHLEFIALDRIVSGRRQEKEAADAAERRRLREEEEEEARRREEEETVRRREEEAVRRREQEAAAAETAEAARLIYGKAAKAEEEGGKSELQLAKERAMVTADLAEAPDLLEDAPARKDLYGPPSAAGGAATAAASEPVAPKGQGKGQGLGQEHQTWQGPQAQLQLEHSRKQTQRREDHQVRMEVLRGAQVI